LISNISLSIPWWQHVWGTPWDSSRLIGTCRKFFPHCSKFQTPFAMFILGRVIRGSISVEGRVARHVYLNLAQPSGGISKGTLCWAFVRPSLCCCRFALLQMRQLVQPRPQLVHHWAVSNNIKNKLMGIVGICDWTSKDVVSERSPSHWKPQCQQNRQRSSNRASSCKQIGMRVR